MQFQDVCVFLSLLAPPSLAVPFESGLDNTLQRRGSCDAWTTETDYTKLSDSTQVVSDMMRGPQRLTVNWGRAQSWTYSFGKEDAADVAVLGTGIAKNFKTARNDTSKYVFEIQAGEMGTVGFTPTLDCAKGHTTCGGKKIQGEICWPRAGHDASDESLAGTWQLITH